MASEACEEQRRSPGLNLFGLIVFAVLVLGCRQPDVTGQELFVVGAPTGLELDLQDPQGSFGLLRSESGGHTSYSVQYAVVGEPTRLSLGLMKYEGLLPGVFALEVNGQPVSTGHIASEAGSVVSTVIAAERQVPGLNTATITVSGVEGHHPPDLVRLRLTSTEGPRGLQDWVLAPTFGLSGSVIASPDDLVSRPLGPQGLGPAKLHPAGEPIDTQQAEFLVLAPADRGAAGRVLLETSSDSSPPQCSGESANVIVYLVDTLRADAVGHLIEGKSTTPELDALSKRSWVWSNASAQSSWTRPAVASLFTGLLPHHHGVNGRKAALAEGHRTLAEELSASGYQTAGFITNPNVAGRLGFRQGFDSFRLLSSTGSEHVTQSALSWISERDQSKPFFLYLHTVDPHAPYQPPEDLAATYAGGVRDPGRFRRPWMRQLKSGAVEATSEVKETLLSLYHAEVATNDRSFGALLRGLGELGLMDSTAIVFLSDHGEEFHERGGWEHGKTLNAEVLEIPLVMWLPGCGSGEISSDASQIDVPATILDYLGLSRSWGDGTSLLGPRPLTPTFSYLDVDGRAGIAVTFRKMKRISSLGAYDFGSAGTFDKHVDPGERFDLTGERTVLAGFLHLAMSESLESWVRDRSTEQPSLPGHMIEQLRTMGYVQ